MWPMIGGRAWISMQPKEKKRIKCVTDLQLNHSEIKSISFRLTAAFLLLLYSQCCLERVFGLRISRHYSKIVNNNFSMLAFDCIRIFCHSMRSMEKYDNYFNFLFISWIAKQGIDKLFFNTSRFEWQHFTDDIRRKIFAIRCDSQLITKIEKKVVAILKLLCDCGGIKSGRERKTALKCIWAVKKPFANTLDRIIQFNFAGNHGWMEFFFRGDWKCSNEFKNR